MEHYLHRSLHFRGYDYLVHMNLVEEYLKYFILKYDTFFKDKNKKMMHHIDDNRNNNRKDNILYVKDRSIHNKLHQEAYFYIVKIGKIKKYIEWFFSKERRTNLNLEGGD